MEFLSVPSTASGNASTRVLILDGTTVKSRTATQIRIDGGGASTTHGATHRINGSDPTNLSQVQVYDNVLLEDGSFLLAEDGTTLVTQGVDDIRPIITQLRTVSTNQRILGRKTAGSGFFEECTLTEVLDFVTGATWGDILYRGQTGWSRLPAGTNGHYLKTQGAGANPVWASVTASSAARRADFCVLDAQGQSGNINAGVADAYPSNAEYSVFRTEFVPTNFTVSLWCISGVTSGAVSGEAGFVLQYNLNPPSASWTGWQDVPNSTVNVRGKSGEYLFTSSTVSIPNPPSVVYWRLRVVSTLLNSSDEALDATCVTSQITISLWN